MAHAVLDLQQLVDTLSILDEGSLVQVVSSVLAARPEAAPPVINFSIPDLTYPPSRALLERRGQGVIKSFNPAAGFGFIQCEDLYAVFGNDVFLHSKQLGGFGPGAVVSFAVCLNKDNKPQAYDLMSVGGGKGCFDGKGSFDGKGCFDGKGGCCGGPWDCKGAWFGKGGWLGDGQWDDWGQGPQTQELNAFAGQMKGMGWSFGGAGKGGPAAVKGQGNTGDESASSMLQRKRPYGQMGGKPEEQMELGQHGGESGMEHASSTLKLKAEQKGTIKSFNVDNGYGFIASPDLQAMGFTNDVFLHHQQRGEAKVGDEVIFTVFLNNKGQPQARDLVQIDGNAAKRHCGGFE